MTEAVANPQAVGNIPTLQSEIDELNGKLKKAVDRIVALENELASLKEAYKVHHHMIDIAGSYIETLRGNPNEHIGFPSSHPCTPNSVWCGHD